MGQAFHVNHTPQFTQLDQCNYHVSHVFQGNTMFLADLFQMVLRLTIGTETHYLFLRFSGLFWGGLLLVLPHLWTFPQADFNFGQFLQAENLPASLFTVRHRFTAEKMHGKCK